MYHKADNISHLSEENAHIPNITSKKMFLNNNICSGEQNYSQIIMEEGEGEEEEEEEEKSSK